MNQFMLRIPRGQANSSKFPITNPKDTSKSGITGDKKVSSLQLTAKEPAKTVELRVIARRSALRDPGKLVQNSPINK